MIRHILVDTDLKTINGNTLLGGGNLVVAAGAIARSINSISSNTTLLAAANTDYVYLCSGTITATLPTAVSNTNAYTIKNTGVGAITIDGAGTETIDGTFTITIGPEDSVDLVSDNANWNII